MGANFSDLQVRRWLNLRPAKNSTLKVDDNYKIHEDPVGLFRVPDMKAETLFTVIKDTCRG